MMAGATDEPIEPDVVMVAAAIYDHSKRLRSYEILSEVRDSMKKAA